MNEARKGSAMMNRTHNWDTPFLGEKLAKREVREPREGRPVGLPMGRTMYSTPTLLGLFWS